MSVLNNNKLRALQGVEKRGPSDSPCEKAVAQGVQKGARMCSVSKTPKSKATRGRIMGAASKIMVERGGTDFQMSEVSSRCELSKGSLYYYFRDRDELVEAIFSERVQDLAHSLENIAAAAPSAYEALVGLASEISKRLRMGGPLALALTRELARGSEGVQLAQSGISRIVKIIAGQLERAKSEGDVRADLNCNTSASFVTGGFLFTLLMESTPSDRAGLWSAASDKDALVKSLFDLSLRGIAVSGAK